MSVTSEQPTLVKDLRDASRTTANDHAEPLLAFPRDLETQFRTKAEKHPLIRVSGVNYNHPVGKLIERSPDGSIKKTPLLEARAEAGLGFTKSFDTAAQLFDYRAAVDAKTMFLTGSFADETDKIVIPKGRLEHERRKLEASAALSVKALTKDNLAFRAGSGVLSIDVDSKKQSELAAIWPNAEPFRLETIDTVYEAIIEMMPEFDGCPAMITASSSSMINDTDGKVVSGPGGWRVLVVIDDATQTPRILDVLHLRCWAQGKFRFAFVSAGGVVLNRSIADQAMSRPKQPDYPCADLGEGLVKSPQASSTFNVEGPYLDTASVVLSDEDRNLATKNMEAARADLAPRAKAIVSKRKSEHAAELLEKGVPKAAAEQAAKRRFEAGVLLGSDVVVFSDGEKVVVAKLLSNGEEYDNFDCLDPVEPGYDDGRPLGRFFWNDGLWPGIHSFAHGSKFYKCRYDDELARSAIDTANRSSERITRILALSELGPIERTQRFTQAAQVLGLGNERKSLKESVSLFRRRMAEHASGLGDEADGAQGLKAPTPLDVPLPPGSFPMLCPTENGGVRILDHADNIRHMLDSYGIGFAYNVIRKDIDWLHPSVDHGGDNSDTVRDSKLLSLCALNKVPTTYLMTHLTALAAENEHNPVVDYLSALKWDGTSRFNALADAMEAADQQVTRIVLRLFLLQACAAPDNAETARSLRPEYRAHFEGILTLVGGQGIGKTKGLRKLLPPKLRPYFREGLLLNLRDKDSITAALSCWIAELGELEGTFKKSDMADLKAFMSKDVDEIRMPYAAKHSKFARRTVFTGTVNDVSFLADETGNRRFWPLTVGKVYVGWDDAEIEQLWAEAWSRYSSGEQWWPSADEERLLAANAEEFRYKSALEEALESYFAWGSPPDRVNGRLTASQIYTKLTHGAAVVVPKPYELKTIGTTMERGWAGSGVAEYQNGVLMVPDGFGGWVRAKASGKNAGWLLPPRKTSDRPSLVQGGPIDN